MDSLPNLSRPNFWQRLKHTDQQVQA